MQRLFTMFPVGAAGIGLLLLRTSVAAALLVDGTAHWFSTALRIVVSFLLVASLLAGFQTPYCASFCCLVALHSLLAGRDFHVLVSVLDSAALAMLGPGAYSLDARIFGRKLLTVNLRRDPDAD